MKILYTRVTRTLKGNEKQFELAGARAIGSIDKAVARFFVTRGIIASSEGTSLVVGSGGILSQKIFKFGGSETLFSTLVMRYVSEKSSVQKRYDFFLVILILSGSMSQRLGDTDNKSNVGFDFLYRDSFKCHLAKD